MIVRFLKPVRSIIIKLKSPYKINPLKENPNEIMWF
jgi:hypothetical protein